MNEGVDESDPRIQTLRERASADSAAHDMRWNWNTPFFQSAHDRSHFYAAGNMVVKSTNWGDGLEPISPDLSYNDREKVKLSTESTGGITRDATGAETYATIVSLAESPLQQGMILAGTDDGRVWITSNDGGEWTELTDRFDGVPAGTYVSRIEPSHFDVDRFYVSFDNHRTNDFTPYAYATDNGGRSFRSISSNLPTGSVDFVHVIREDTRNENLLFVGTDVGAYVSTDRGATWQRFMEGLHAVPVHDLQIHPRDRELIAGTHGRSIWIVDIAPLQDLTDQVIADGAALFEPKPGFQFGMPPRGGEFYAQSWFSRPTPGMSAEISYFIGEALAEELQTTFEESRERARAQQQEGGEERPGMAEGGQGGGQSGPRRPQVEVIVANEDGEVLDTIQGPATAGIHTVRWGYRGQPSEQEEPGPYEQQERDRVAERAEVVADSLIEAGWNETTVRRSIGVFTGETSNQAFGRSFGGSTGGQSRDPEAYRERPGERMSGGQGGGGTNRTREIFGLMFPDQDYRTVMRRFRRGGGQGDRVGPGTYSLTLKAGDKTFTQSLTVKRVGGFGDDTPPLENER